MTRPRGARPVDLARLGDDLARVVAAGAPKPRKRAAQLNADDFVDAFLARLFERHDREGWPGLGNAVRAYLGKPPKRGLVQAARVDEGERVELKARLFDLFFEVYGPRLPGALRMAKAQERGSAAGVAARQSKKSEILRESAKLQNSGRTSKSIPGIVARKCGVTRDYAQKVMKKARPT